MQARTFIGIIVGLACVFAIPDGLMFGDDPRKPSELTGTHVCEACNAVIHEVITHLPPTRKEFDVYGAVESVCSMEKLRSYQFIPPDMVKACQKFFSEVGDDLEIEEAIQKGMTWQDTIKLTCQSVCSDSEMDTFIEQHDRVAAADAPKPKRTRKKKKKSNQKRDKQKKDKQTKSEL